MISTSVYLDKYRMAPGAALAVGGGALILGGNYLAPFHIVRVVALGSFGWALSGSLAQTNPRLGTKVALVALAIVALVAAMGNSIVGWGTRDMNRLGERELWGVLLSIAGGFYLGFAGAGFYILLKKDQRDNR